YACYEKQFCEVNRSWAMKNISELEGSYITATLPTPGTGTRPSTLLSSELYV
ncbi:unnamed protein product, partial [marine sediment metagenome]